jgi:ElaB/YqjD/DUF883 family membrane-anchored ribosome-binding protein
MQQTDIQGSTRTADNNLSQHTSTGASHLSDKAHDTFNRVSDAASEVANRISERSRELLDSPTAQNARTYVREHPLTAIGIAVAVGLLISRLTSRR